MSQVCNRCFMQRLPFYCWFTSQLSHLPLPSKKCWLEEVLCLGWNVFVSRLSELNWASMCVIVQSLSLRCLNLIQLNAYPRVTNVNSGNMSGKYNERNKRIMDNIAPLRNQFKSIKTFEKSSWLRWTNR